MADTKSYHDSGNNDGFSVPSFRNLLVPTDTDNPAMSNKLTYYALSLTMLGENQN